MKEIISEEARRRLREILKYHISYPDGVQPMESFCEEEKKEEKK